MYFRLYLMRRGLLAANFLISQVLGRGLRIPEAYLGQKPVVTIFNHDRWSGRIKHLVDKVLEIENRIYSYPVAKNPDYNFHIHTIDYSKTTEVEEYKQEKDYDYYFSQLRNNSLNFASKLDAELEKNGV